MSHVELKKRIETRDERLLGLDTGPSPQSPNSKRHARAEPQFTHNWTKHDDGDEGEDLDQRDKKQAKLVTSSYCQTASGGLPHSIF